MYKRQVSELFKTGRPVIDDRIGNQDVRIRYDDYPVTAEIARADGSPLPGVMAYWFAWYAFHPETQVYKAAAAQPGSRTEAPLAQDGNQ